MKITTITIVRTARAFVSLLALTATSLFAAGVMPDRLSGRIFEPPCEFDDGSDEWACSAGPHDYQGSCEGIDCYSSMEFCCIIVE
jgi:hypothetical protein